MSNFFQEEQIGFLRELIALNGYTLLTQSLIPVEEMESERFSKEPRFSLVNDGEVTTVGMRFLNAPDLHFFVGPFPGEIPLSSRELAVRLGSVVEFIDRYYQNVRNRPLDVDSVIKASDDRLYAVTDKDPFGYRNPIEYTKNLTEFYGDTNYSVLLIYPMFSDSLSLFANQLSKKRH